MARELTDEQRDEIRHLIDIIEKDPEGPGPYGLNEAAFEELKRKLSPTMAEFARREVAMPAVRGAIRGWDIPVGLMRAGLAGMHDIPQMALGMAEAAGVPGLTPLEQMQTMGRPGDLLRILTGDAPTLLEYPERIGKRPEGLGAAALTVGGMLIDPLTWTGTRAATRAEDILAAVSPTEKSRLAQAIGRPVSAVARRIEESPALHSLFDRASNLMVMTGLGKTGKWIYEQGLKKLDLAAAEFKKEGMKAPSRVFHKHGITGTARSMREKIDTTLSELHDQYFETLNLLRKASPEHSAVDMEKAMTKARDMVDKELSYFNAAGEMIKPGGDRLKYNAAVKLRELIDDFSKGMKPAGIEEKIPIGPRELPTDIVDPIRASELKTSLYKELGDKAYRDLLQSSFGQDVKKEMARGIKQEIFNAVDRASYLLQNAAEKSGQTAAAHMYKKLPAILDDTLSDMGTLLTSRKALKGRIREEVTKPYFTGFEALAASISLGPTATKKFVDTANTGIGRVLFGTALEGAATSPMVNVPVRRALIELERRTREGERAPYPQTFEMPSGWIPGGP